MVVHEKKIEMMVKIRSRRSHNPNLLRTGRRRGMLVSKRMTGNRIAVTAKATVLKSIHLFGFIVL